MLPWPPIGLGACHEAINIFDYEALAKARLPGPTYDHIAGGATDEITSPPAQWPLMSARGPF
ncbi:MAG: hypothetical protein FJ039_01570 [Chloroflexi bacterium]|nr:hypothetical protein [Chloroflexota bacterium]